MLLYSTRARVLVGRLSLGGGAKADRKLTLYHLRQTCHFSWYYPDTFGWCLNSSHAQVRQRRMMRKMRCGKIFVWWERGKSAAPGGSWPTPHTTPFFLPPEDL
jgi:hypothetical protein